MKAKFKFEFEAEVLARNVLLFLSIIGFMYAIKYAMSNLDKPQNINIILVLPFIIFMTPYLILSLYQLRKIEAKMYVIPRFLRDVVDNAESGMDLISSINATRNNEYGVLNEDIQKFSNQLSWGVDFETAMLSFSKNIKSKELYRDFRLIIEARRVGGHIEKTLRELSVKIDTENLRKKERKSSLAANTFTGYISFMIFIFIIIVVYNNLFLEIIDISSGGGSGAVSLEVKVFLSFFTLLSYELAILSGLLFGLMQESNIVKGAPHVVALVIATFVGFFFFVTQI
ncbi:type II secretion system F family protein [Candidatus Woesearchaeota archaeon]|nr:type II secretion system F family protein [Nanoarchaeota archaeon]MCB9369998.1 type II secretion system F family protein [Candidatus Woesearchaeota archaeon]USN44533.1 MAG: type II secretion system F family protein [Candidatus Woesearchaeota archaeon]